MAVHYALLRFVAKAALNHVGFGVAGDFAVEVLPELVKDVWNWWHKDRTPQQMREEAQAVAILAPPNAEKLADEIVAQEAGGESEEKRRKVKAYLTQMPTAIIASQRRPSDPTGRTVSSHLLLTKPEDVIPLLPQRVPRFKAGDRPAGIGDWELVELLGVGGFGEVWKAKNPHFDGMPPVALKFCLDKQAANLLRYEAGVLARVSMQNNPAIVRLLFSCLGVELPCLAYEYVGGGDLTSLFYRHLKQNQGKANPDYVRKIILSLARGLSHPHRQTPPIVHRDMKPANVLVERKADGTGTLRITDFGIGGVAASQAIEQEKAMTTGRGMTVLQGAHTPLYASPQQRMGLPSDPRDDVHALGVMWYQMLVGNMNKGAPTGNGWKKGRVERSVTAHELDLIQSCFDEDPDCRPRDAKELADLIAGLTPQSELVSTAPVPPKPAPERPRLLRPGDRRPLRWKPADPSSEAEMLFAWIPPGKFLMGGTAEECEMPVHEVTLTRGFYLGIFPVTQAQWAWVLGRDERPSFYPGDDRPVEMVSRDECQVFCARLRKLTGQPVRLPTEAEWECACGAESNDDYYCGNGERALEGIGWYSGNSGGQTHPVGKKGGNYLGLFDMHGNVWEWTADWFDPEYYRKGENVDPQGPAHGNYPVLRGGSCSASPEDCRAAFRFADPEPEGSGSDIGFRVCFCPN